MQNNSLSNIACCAKLSMKVVRERDNLGKHLLRRNNECSLLYEKIRIQHSVLSKGDFHYKERMKDINLLKLELRRLRRKKSILDSTSSDTEDLRQVSMPRSSLF